MTSGRKAYYAHRVVDTGRADRGNCARLHTRDIGGGGREGRNGIEGARKGKDKKKRVGGKGEAHGISKRAAFV